MIPPPSSHSHGPEQTPGRLLISDQSGHQRYHRARRHNVLLRTRDVGQSWERNLGKWLASGMKSNQCILLFMHPLGYLF